MRLPFFFFALIPGFAFPFLGERGWTAVPFSVLHHALFFMTLLTSAVVIRRVRFLKWCMTALAATYGTVLAFLIVYFAVTGGPFDYYFFMDSFAEILPTGYEMFGLNGMALIVGFLVFVWASSLLLFRAALASLPSLRAGRGLLLVVLLGAVLSEIPPVEGSLFDQVEHVQVVAGKRQVVFPEVPDNSMFETDSDESIFFLQLESLNAIAATGRGVYDGVPYDGDYIPVMHAIAKGSGVWLPLFWGNTIQTTRAQATIFCGTVNNVADALSFTPDKITTDCLPEILKRAGYRTVFLSSYHDGNFHNLENFLYAIGFDDVRFADFMEEDDQRYKWGYDDCTFYDRAFTYLKETYPDPEEQKLFVFFEADVNHTPFRPRSEYENVHPFEHPKNYVERYLDAVSEQDHCVGEFYAAYTDYADTAKTHLLVMPDTSWAAGEHGNTDGQRKAFNENFLIPFAYVPPENRRDEFRIGEELTRGFSQADLIPTIFELLNGGSYPQSFAFALKKNGERGTYEDCHMLTQPYGGGEVAVVRGDDKVVYHLSDETLTYVDIGGDFLEQEPVVLSRDMPYGEFLETYFCDRYSRQEAVAFGVWEGSVHLGDQSADFSWKESYWDAFEGQPASEVLTIPLDLPAGTRIAHVELNGANMEARNPIFINGEEVGKTCSTSKSEWTCVAHLDTPFTLPDGENILEIRPGETRKRGNLDDFVLRAVNVLVAQEEIR